MTSPFIPNSFSYGDSPQGGVVMPMIIAGRNPTTSDRQYSAGYLWLSDLSLGGSGSTFIQSGTQAGIPQWATLSAGAAGPLLGLSNGIIDVDPSGVGRIAIEGTPNQIVSTSNPPAHNITLSLPNNVTIPNNLTVTNDLLVSGDATISQTLTINGTLTFNAAVTINSTLDVTGLTTLAALTQAGTLLLNTTGAAATTIGSIAAGAILIDVGVGNFQINGNGNDINIGDDAAVNDIVIGSTSGASSTHIQAGTGDLLIDGAVTTAITIGDVNQTGTITLGLSTAGQDIDIGSAVNVGAQVISIGNGASAANSTVNILSGAGTAGTAILSLGNNPRVTTADLANFAPVASRTVTVGGGTVITAAVTDTIDIGPDGATTNANSVKVVNVNTGGVTLGQVLTNIASGAVTSGTHTTNIASGNMAAGTVVLNISTGTSAGTKTVNLGNADGNTTFNVKGLWNLNVSQNSNTFINTGTSTGTVSIGNNAAGAIAIDTASTLIIGSATNTGTFTFGASTAAAGQTINISSAASIAGSNIVNVLAGATPAANQTFNLMTGVGTAGTYAVNVLTGNSVGTIQTINLGTGSAQTDITLGGIGANVIKIGNTQTAGSIALGDLMTTGTIQIGGANQTGATAIIIGNSVAAGGSTIQIGNAANAGAQIINIASGAAGAASTVNILSGNAAAGIQTLNLATGTGGKTVNIANANDVNDINIGNGVTGTSTIKIGTTNATSSLELNAGSGNIAMSGIVTKATNPAFLGYLAATVTDVTGTGTAYTLGTDALTEVFDRGAGGNFTTAGVFTAPVTGIYDLRAQVTVTGTTIATTFVISIVTTVRSYIHTFIKAAGNQDESVFISALADMTAADTAHVTIAVTGEGGDTADILGAASCETYFCGCLVG